MIWQGNREQLKFTLFATRDNNFLLSSDSDCIKSILENEKGTAYSMINKVFNQINFYKNGTIIELLQNKTP